MLLQGRLHLISKLGALIGKPVLLIDSLEYLRCLTKRNNSKEVGRNEEFEGSGIVRRAERRSNESAWLHWISPAHITLGIELTVGLSQENITTMTILPLLFLKDLQGELDGIKPFVTKDGNIPCSLPISIGKTYRIAVRINLPLALKHISIRLGAGYITLASSTCGTIIECIGIRIDAYQLELTDHRTCNHLGKVRIICGIAHVWPHLGSRIPEPHGSYIAGIDKGISPSVVTILIKVDSCIESIRIAILEHPRQLRIIKLSLYLPYLLLHDP